MDEQTCRPSLLSPLRTLAASIRSLWLCRSASVRYAMSLKLVFLMLIWSSFSRRALAAPTTRIRLIHTLTSSTHLRGLLAETLVTWLSATLVTWAFCYSGKKSRISIIFFLLIHVYRPFPHDRTRFALDTFRHDYPHFALDGLHI